jgi:hypothetical protein
MQIYGSPTAAYVAWHWRTFAVDGHADTSHPEVMAKGLQCLQNMSAQSGVVVSVPVLLLTDSHVAKR